MPCACFPTTNHPSLQWFRLIRRRWSFKWLPLRVWWHSETLHQITWGQRLSNCASELYELAENHWQQHISTSFRTESSERFFFVFFLTLTLWEITLIDIRNTAALLRLLCLHWLNIPLVFDVEFNSGFLTSCLSGKRHSELFGKFKKI